jgi:Flp pilus assembly protein TadB
MAVIGAAIGVAGIATSVVMSKQAGDAAKKAGKKARAQQLGDQAAADKAAKRAQTIQDNEAFFQDTRNQLAMRSGVAGENASAFPQQIIVPVALGTVAVALGVILLARRKR